MLHFKLMLNKEKEKNNKHNMVLYHIFHVKTDII